MAGNVALERFHRSKWEQLRRAVSLAAEHRRKVREGDLSVFLIPLTLVLAKDFLFDPLSAIPIFGQLIVGLLFCFPITVYLFIFMWGRGKLWLRFVFFIIALLDLIPFLSLIPFGTASVLYAYHLAKKDADASKGEAEKLEQAIPKLNGQLRSAEVAMQQEAAAEAEQAAQEQANQERGAAANDDQFRKAA